MVIRTSNIVYILLPSSLVEDTMLLTLYTYIRPGKKSFKVRL